MVRVFHETGPNATAETLWSFSYVDWQGRKQVSVGTESRLETQRLAERVQAEHDVLRKAMRPKVTTPPPAILEPERRDEDPQTLLVEPPDQAIAAPAPMPQYRSHGAEKPLHGVRVGDQLVETNVISGAQLDEALAHQKLFGGRIINILIQLGYLTAEDFLVFMGNRPGIPRIVLDNYAWLSKEVLELIPADMAAELEVIPIDRLGKTISVAMVCPIDLDALERIQEHTGLKIRPLLCSRPELRTALRIHYGDETSLGRAVRK